MIISESTLFLRWRSFISDSCSKILTFKIFSSLCKKSFSISLELLFAAELGFLPFFLLSDPLVAEDEDAAGCDSCVGRNGATFGLREEPNRAEL